MKRLRDFHRIWNPDELVGLDAEAPMRMGEAIGDRRAVFSAERVAIHRLQPEMSEIEAAQRLPGRGLPAERPASAPRRGCDEGRAGLGADAQPVDAGGGACVPLVSTAI